MKRLISLAPACALTFALLALSACGPSAPVRHLASDAALIRPGETTLAELHQYLGEPKGVREVSPGVKEYVYSEDLKSGWSKVPFMDSVVSANGYEMLIVTVKDEVAQKAVFRKFSEKERAWVKDYDWK